jgi:hypothetical protein
MMNGSVNSALVDEAYQWLCQQRKNFPVNSDVWDVRFHWSEVKTVTMVLHTWGQALSQHIHMHCLVPGGALDATNHWQSVKTDYLFPVKALSKLWMACLTSSSHATCL